MVTRKRLDVTLYVHRLPCNTHMLYLTLKALKFQYELRHFILGRIAFGGSELTVTLQHCRVDRKRDVKTKRHTGLRLDCTCYQWVYFE